MVGQQSINVSNHENKDQNLWCQSIPEIPSLKTHFLSVKLSLSFSPGGAFSLQFFLAAV